MDKLIIGDNGLVVRQWDIEGVKRMVDDLYIDTIKMYNKIRNRAIAIGVDDNPLFLKCKTYVESFTNVIKDAESLGRIDIGTYNTPYILCKGTVDLGLKVDTHTIKLDDDQEKVVLSVNDKLLQKWEYGRGRKVELLPLGLGLDTRSTGLSYLVEIRVIEKDQTANDICTIKVIDNIIGYKLSFE